MQNLKCIFIKIKIIAKICIHEENKKECYEKLVV